MLSTCERWRLEPKKCNSLKGYSQSWTLSNKLQCVLWFALMLKSFWTERWDCFSCYKRLNSPVGRFSSLWVIIKLFQVLASFSNLAEKAGATRGKKKNRVTGPLKMWKPPLWANVEMYSQQVLLFRWKLNAIKRAVQSFIRLKKVFFIPKTLYPTGVRGEKIKKCINSTSCIILQDFPFYNNNELHGWLFR